MGGKVQNFHGTNASSNAPQLIVYQLQDGTCGRTALHLTVESHNIHMINFLLKNGADVNATTFSGNTPLHLASGLGMDQVVQLLIRNGADINITNIEGDTPLYTKVR